MPVTSSFTPLELLRLPLASALREEFVGRPISSLRTPAVIIDRAAFKENCAQMGAKVDGLGMHFRAHIKTHKTPEGTRLQIAGGARTLVASTMPEVWGVLEAGIDAGDIDDILLSLPISADRMEDLNDAQEKAGNIKIRVMVDHAEQVSHLSAAAKRLGRKAPWSMFIKVDGGGNRAGAPPRSAQMDALLQACKDEPAVEIFGFLFPFRAVLCFAQLRTGGPVLCRRDRDATSLVREGGLALTVLATVVSKYPHRNGGEVLTDCGALAVSKDVGPVPGFGRVVSKGHEGWSLGRVSQEHGVLTRKEGAKEIEINEQVRIVPNHACLACACHPWFYIIDGGGDKVVDVWVPWKGW
ncbi:hypothetical protein CcaverHIS002_0104600 [Cutaneotrichosporon cavernicola]|nr:hypothetical protein CcaverHIS002_0104600 [Cutaneotrichosporon cavernicola]